MGSSGLRKALNVPRDRLARSQLHHAVAWRQRLPRPCLDRGFSLCFGFTYGHGLRVWGLGSVGFRAWEGWFSYGPGLEVQGLESGG